MKYLAIQEKEAYRLLDEPHGTAPGSPLEPDEWHFINAELRRLLDQFGDWNAYEDGDYYLPDSANATRVIPVVFTSQKMVEPQVLEAITKFLNELREDYRVDLTISADYDYFLFLSKGGVRGWCSAELESKAGLERQ